MELYIGKRLLPGFLHGGANKIFIKYIFLHTQSSLFLWLQTVLIEGTKCKECGLLLWQACCVYLHIRCPRSKWRNPVKQAQAYTRQSSAVRTIISMSQQQDHGIIQMELFIKLIWQHSLWWTVSL